MHQQSPFVVRDARQRSSESEEAMGFIPNVRSENSVSYAPFIMQAAGLIHKPMAVQCATCH